MLHIALVARYPRPLHFVAGIFKVLKFENGGWIFGLRFALAPWIAAL
jgi:hypothetical protein